MCFIIPVSGDSRAEMRLRATGFEGIDPKSAAKENISVSWSVKPNPRFYTMESSVAAIFHGVPREPWVSFISILVNASEPWAGVKTFVWFKTNKLSLLKDILQDPCDKCLICRVREH